MRNQARTGEHAGADFVVRKLAQQTQRPFEEVRDVYERELEDALAQARVMTYVAVIAERHAREILRRQ